ncbi:MAG: ATP-binding cassette domain-containing protein [Candidatus Sumerlaeota bacterium]|nr:ATP-binding cassette domain-containing protein [Candidatus Sumerlaeota bacterium]
MSESSSSRALLLEGVTKRFGDFTAVDALSFHVPRGCVFGFIGPNGAGKTTTIRMILDILRPDEGRIEALGQAMSEELKNRLGYLPEEHGLYKKMRVRDTLRYFAGLKGADPRAVGRDIPTWLERFGLAEWADRRIEELSKGMQQKTQFLVSVLHRPELLVLDEPFAGLDPVNLAALRDAIVDLKREGRTVLFSTHVMEVAEKICDDVLMIHRGRKVLDGPMDTILGGQVEHVAVVAYEGDGAFIRTLPGVAAVNDYGNYVEVRLLDGADSQDLLRALVDRVRILRFEMRRTTLTEVFLRLAGGDSQAESTESRL